jgi:hypothetical protein
MGEAPYPTPAQPTSYLPLVSHPVATRAVATGVRRLPSSPDPLADGYISAPVGSSVRPNPNALLPPRSDPPPPRFFSVRRRSHGRCAVVGAATVPLRRRRPVQEHRRARLCRAALLFGAEDLSCAVSASFPTSDPRRRRRRIRLLRLPVEHI